MFRKSFALLLLFSLNFVAFSPAVAGSPAGRTDKTDVIGQGINAVIYVHPAAGSKSSPDSAIRKAFGEGRRLFKDLDQKTSGELSQINKNAGKNPIKVSEPMLLLLRVCLQVSEWTHGLFDVVKSPDKKEAILQVDFGRGEVKLLRKKSWVDFTGIRNGYVVDRMAGILKAEGYSDFMIQTVETPKGATDAVVRTMGRDGSDYWRLNVADPNGSGKGLCRVSLEASSVATADIRSLPKTATDLQSVTIIARNATNATALAHTALLAGRERARGMLAAITEPGFGAILEDNHGKIQTLGDVTAACFEE